MAGLYDTLDSVEIENHATLHDLYTWVMGLPMAQADVCGTVTTGSLNFEQAHGGTWGRFLQFSGHHELWAVRSAPIGRLGQPLEFGEVRQVAVLLRESERSARARVSVIKLWRVPADSVELIPRLNERQRDRGTLTHGAVGVAVHGINLFDDFVTPSSKFYATHGTHSVLSSVASIFQSETSSAVCRVEAAALPRYIMGGAISGVLVPENGQVRPCVEQCTEASWLAGMDNDHLAFSALVMSSGYSCDREMPAKLLRAAENIFEQCSFVGYLDMIADPFYEGALPDDAFQPTGIPLMLAIAVRIACDPTRWGLPAPKAEDAYATKEVALLIESVAPCLVATGDDGVSGMQTFGTDVVINRALDAMESNVRKMQSGKLDGTRGGVDHRKVSHVIKQTLHFFYCTGVALCQDVCGLAPQESDGSSGLHTSIGFAQHLADPVRESRTQSAYDAGLGRAPMRWPSVRTSTKGQRQIALADVLVSVEQWLVTRKFRGMVRSLTAQAPDSVDPQDLDPAAAPAPAARPASAMSSVMARSAKKKKKHVEAMLAERGKMRGASGQYCATQAVAALLGDKKDPRVAVMGEHLSGQAVNEASGVFADVMQCGGCAGIGKLFDVASYLVRPKSAVRCGSCEQFVNVAQSVAFAGMLGQCASPTCTHPRCLACVARDIKALGRGGAPKRMENCLFCVHRDAMRARAA